MRILKIEIEEFGKLCDRLFLLGEGMNLIEGANESGKSTLLAFIRFVLYGFPRKGGADGEEREKRLSWHTGRAAGRLVLRTQTGDYAVFRSVVRQGNAARENFAETLSVTALAGGEEVFLDGMTPGEYFLGLPAALYDSTLCLRQSDAARVSEPGVSEAVSEMLFTGSTGVSADAAIEKLRAARRELQHQKGRGGRIAELADRITVAQDTLLRAREDSGTLSAIRADVARYRTQVRERREELETISGQLEESAAGETLALFDRAHAARSVCEQKRLNYESLHAQCAPLEGVPQMISGVQEALRERESARVESLQALPELERMRAVRHDERMLAAHALLLEKGGAQTVLEDFRTAKKKKKSAAKAGWIFLLITLLFAAVTGLLITGILTPLLLRFLPVEEYLIWIYLGGIAATLLWFFVMVGCFVRSARFSQRIRAWVKRLGVGEVQMFRTYLEQCTCEAQSAEAHRTLLVELESVYAEKQGRVARAEERVREALQAAGLPMPEDLDSIPSLLAQYEESYRAAQEQLREARGEWERAYAAWESLSASLEGKNEAELRAKFAGKGAWDPDELRRKQMFLRETLAGLEKKAAEAERQESALSATAKDPAVGESELAALRAEHRNATRRHAALEMAISAMEQGVQNLGENLVPRLCEHACVHFAALTGGAYEKLYIASDFSVRVDGDNGPLPLSHFSAGCRDAAHLALRLGLLDTLSGETLPLLFDEAFARLDDGRAHALLQCLMEYCNRGGQCLLFTCHSREGEFLMGENITHFELR